MDINEHAVITDILKRALNEDLSLEGDITSKALFSSSDTATASIRSKQDGVLAGAYLLQPLFALIDPAVRVDVVLSDGAQLRRGSEICRLNGSVHAILAGERTALNFLQRLSGIATRTSRMTGLLQGHHTRLLDTRKTTPTLRILEKKAVVAGGALNHRFGLFDMILIKDTHVKAAGGAGAAVRMAKAARDKACPVKIEVEVQSYEECLEAAAEGPDRIMLDNMSCENMTRCVNYLHEHHIGIETEASGNITEETISRVAGTGVDFISSGSLTHSVIAVDIHLIIL